MFGLVYIRRLKDLTAAEVADKLDVKRAAVAAWERKKNIPLKRLKALSDIFDGLNEEYFSKELTEKEKLYIQHYITMKDIDSHQEEYEKNTPDEFQTESEFFFNSKLAQKHVYETEKTMYELVHDLTPLSDYSDLYEQEQRLEMYKKIFMVEKQTNTRELLKCFLKALDMLEQKKEPEDAFELDLYYAIYKKKKLELIDNEMQSRLFLDDEKKEKKNNE